MGGDSLGYESYSCMLGRQINSLSDLHNTYTTPNIIITQITRPYALSINLDFLNVEIVNCELLIVIYMLDISVARIREEKT